MLCIKIIFDFLHCRIIDLSDSLFDLLAFTLCVKGMSEGSDKHLMNQNSQSPRPFLVPEPEISAKLAASKKEVIGMTEQDLRCPICKFRIAGVFEEEDRSGHIRIKCQKCKFQGVINLTYF